MPSLQGGRHHVGQERGYGFLLGAAGVICLPNLLQQSEMKEQNKGGDNAWRCTLQTRLYRIYIDFYWINWTLCAVLSTTSINSPTVARGFGVRSVRWNSFLKKKQPLQERLWQAALRIIQKCCFWEEMLLLNFVIGCHLSVLWAPQTKLLSP